MAGLDFSPSDMPGDSGFTLFDRRARLFATARRVFLARLLVDELDPAVAALVSDEVLPHVERVERGLHATLRAGSVATSALAALVRRAGIHEAPLPWSVDAGRATEAQARERAAGRGTGVRLLEMGLLEDVAHADLVLSFIPRLPEAAVGWPLLSSHTYADIAAPADAGERIARIEEIERVLWRLATGSPLVPEEPWRRTFAFFEAGVWFDRAALGLPPLSA